MNANDRVKITADALERSGFAGWQRLVDFAMRGTIQATVRPSYYVRVLWDDGELTLLTPGTAAKILVVCEPGDDAAPRHDWQRAIDVIDASDQADATQKFAASGMVDEDELWCRRCCEAQTDDNDLGPCYGKRS